MPKRFVSIWFRHLVADWKVRRQPELKDTPFVFAAPQRGRMVVQSASRVAKARGVYPPMVVADCKAVLPGLVVFDHPPGIEAQLLNALAEWCIRFTPIAAIDIPDGLVLDTSGCTHLWGGEAAYLQDIFTKLRSFGYDVKVAMADTVGAAWAISRFGQNNPIVASGAQLEAIMPLPATALRLETTVTERLHKLGLYQVQSFINMPRRSLRRRFGASILTRLDQALGQEVEVIEPVQPLVPYLERLPCLEPIRAAKGIEIALKKLLLCLCERLEKEDLGLRSCIFRCYRIDGNIQQVVIGTNRASRNTEHLFKLFEIRIPTIEPALGFELFTLEASKTEDLVATQDALWLDGNNCDVAGVTELLDKIGNKTGMNSIHRYLPAEHHWPERSYKTAKSFNEQATTTWRPDLPRPIYILPQPELIEVTVPLPDYPPMLFLYKGVIHNIRRADGPERIEQEWWLQQGLYRDYYHVEDEQGGRYWLFRAGDYYNNEPKWYIHGFFA